MGEPALREDLSVGELTPTPLEQESCACHFLVAAFQRVGPVPHLDSTVELSLDVGAADEQAQRT